MSVAESYDLIDRPWLLVRSLDGTVSESSLMDTFRTADRLAGLVGDVPTQVFALTRLLLAIVHRALDGVLDEDAWALMWQGDGLPVERIESYLGRHRSRFDLLHPQTPFFQVGGLHTTKGEVSALDKLVADVPNGEPFFSMRLDRSIALSLPEAARWLVHCHAFDPSGIKSGAVGDDRVKHGKGYPIGTGWSGYLGGVLPEGASLLETLLLNLVPTTPQDLPTWEREAPGPQEVERTPSGAVDLYTWQSRRIRLVSEQDRVTAVLICNGDRITPQNKHVVETHTAWRRSQTQEKKLGSSTPVYMPLEHMPERLIWRGLQAMLPSTTTSAQRTEAAARLSPEVLRWISRLTDARLLPKGQPLRLRTIGMTYGSQSSTTAEIVDDAVTLHAVLLDQGAHELRQVVLDCVHDAENAAYALGGLAVGLAEAAGTRESDGPRARAGERAYARLDPLFRTWLARLGPDADPIDSKTSWHTDAAKAVRRLAEQLIAGAPLAAWQGRVINQRWWCTAHADRKFDRDLRAALPMARQWAAKKEVT
ncbi:type I-E CRISPR-associated protein Cse1/CasA [Actinokineospora sp. NBRC 105648]|uniref:type I-E CRISPR-associated protein Cse1/CasA n=1 Tax=Actinokineospora sp. NBRC 105648 TaxID=3032206 RepID=UPI0024A49B91|nr:type I-E CRISPR-associated protein Cse1/CasA [Actinokineospora sp. NBRC 105648]GLZ38737.1 type I-E CRISPR-associated protein Cse1/CasA [Actinokineospora sp. NBRC 105648]